MYDLRISTFYSLLSPQIFTPSLDSNSVVAVGVHDFDIIKNVMKPHHYFIFPFP